jgi:hypothetical protein
MAKPPLSSLLRIETADRLAILAARLPEMLSLPNHGHYAGRNQAVLPALPWVSQDSEACSMRAHSTF